MTADARARGQETTRGRAPETEALWREFHDRLLAYLRRRVPTTEDAEDVLQEVFVRIHQNRHHLKGVHNVRAWIRRVASNAIVDHFRKRSSEGGPLAPLSFEPEEREAPLCTERKAGTRESEPSAALSRCLEPLLERLPGHYREAIRATELGGLTQKDAAAGAGISLSGMKARVQRGRGKLKELLLDCCDVELDGRRGVIGYRRRGDDDPCGCDCS